MLSGTIKSPTHIFVKEKSEKLKNSPNYQFIPSGIFFLNLQVLDKFN